MHFLTQIRFGHARVDVHHDVLDLGKGFLDLGVHALRDGVGLGQRKARVRADFEVHVHAASEHAGVQHVHAQHALPALGAAADGGLQAVVAGVVHHAVDGVLEDLQGRLQYEQADDEAGDGLHHGDAQPRPHDARQRADGGQRVAAMVPGLGLQGRRLVFRGVVAGVAIHALLDEDGGNRRRQRQQAGRGQALTVAGDDLTDGVQADAAAHQRQYHRQQDRSDALEALVPTDEPEALGFLTLRDSVEIYKEDGEVGYYSLASDEFYPYNGKYTVLGYLNNESYIAVDNVDADITSVNTFVSGEYGSFAIFGDADVKLTTIGDNVFVSRSGSEWAGISVGKDASLTVTKDSDVLVAIGDMYYAGIGGGEDFDAGNITIDGGVVFAIGGYDGAGIGGGNKHSFKNITINGGRVYAECISDDAAGIGTGDDGIGGDIVINGGDITAYSLDDDGAGIGGADEGYIDSITINGGVIHVASDDAAAIGGGSSSDSLGGKITINGGLIIEDYIDSSAAFIGNDYDNDADPSDKNFVQINGGNFISGGLIFPDPYNKNGKKLEKKTLTVADKLANSDVTLTLANGTKYTAPAYGNELCVYLPIDTAVSNQKYIETGDITKVFNDAKSGRWYINAVEYNYVNGFISGMSATEFGVSTPVTRGMFITMLARIAGVDTSNNNVKTKFTDVESGRYYTGAIKWASDNKIVAGMTDTTFEPNSALQRQQLCVMIVNFAKHLKIEFKPAEAAITFADASGIGNYAKTAVAACQTADIVNGYNEGGKIFFKPTNTATRAEAAQILYKFHSDFCK